MKIVILEGLSVNPGDLSWEPIEQLGDVTIYDRTTHEQAAERIEDAQIVLVNKVPITAEIMDTCPNLRLICVLATGYNVIDCDAARSRGIRVCNVPTYGTNAVAQFTFSLLLELCNRVGHHDNLVHNGRWCTCPDFCFWDTTQIELAEKTMGIIGFGKIGKAVGKIAKAFGMNILAYNRSQSPEGAEIAKYVDLETLLNESDVISLHCPLTEATQNLINQQTIAKMKDGVILINTARGQLLNERDVVAALENGKLRAAAVDVASKEPIEKSNPLLTAPNCIITPHMAWSPVESRQRIIEITAQNIQAYIAGDPIHVVNN